MRIRLLVTATLLLLGAHQAAADGDYPPDGKLGVRFGPWEIRRENGCSVARNVIDVDNLAIYAFWVEPLLVEVMARGGKMVGGRLSVEGGMTKKFICSGGERCALDRTDLNNGLRSGAFAVLELDLTEGRKAGPFKIPLEDLSALLFLGCGNHGDKGPAPPKPPPPKWENMNPEPQVAPLPRR